MTSPIRILLIDDSQETNGRLATGLSERGFDCRRVQKGAEAIEQVQEVDFQVVLLDLGLADDSALGILRCLRELDRKLSIIMLTQADSRQELIASFEAGADDFIVKPISVDETATRIEVAFVRSRVRPSTALEFGSLKMDLSARRVVRGERQIALTPTEFRILEILMRNQGRVVTRRMLCEFLWNPEWEGVTNVIEVHINRLRSKITQASEDKLIHTVRGRGYELRQAHKSDQDQRLPIQRQLAR